MATTFEIGVTNFRAIQLHGVRRRKDGSLTVTGISIDGRLTVPTRSFWNSLGTELTDAADSVQGLSPEETFNKIVKRAANKRIRYCLEHDNAGNTRCMAIKIIQSTGRCPNSADRCKTFPTAHGPRNSRRVMGLHRRFRVVSRECCGASPVKHS